MSKQNEMKLASLFSAPLEIKINNFELHQIEKSAAQWTIGITSYCNAVSSNRSLNVKPHLFIVFYKEMEAMRRSCIATLEGTGQRELELQTTES